MKLSVKEKIMALLSALPVEYASEARILKREDHERLYEIVPQLEEVEKAVETELKPLKAPTNEKFSHQALPKVRRFSTNAEKKSCRFHNSTNHSSEECYLNKVIAKANLVVVEKVNNKSEDIFYSLNNLGCGGEQVGDLIMDSGASFHLTPDKNKITTYIPIYNKAVILPDGSKVRIKGKGTVTIDALINGESKPFTLTEVRLLINWPKTIAM